MEKPKDPVFIVGVPRSGTTLLLRTMQRHSSFVHADARRLESNAVALLFEHLDADRPPPGQLTAFLATDDLPDEVTGVIRRLRPWRLLVRRLVRGRRSAWSPRAWKLAGEHLIVRRYFEASRRLRGTRVIEKTPAHLQRVLNLRVAFPDARFVALIRHPVDVLSSYWRRFEREGEAQPWWNVSVESMAEIWGTGVRTSELFAARFPEAFLLVRYEDMVADPEAVIRRICAHVVEPFDPACIERFDETATVQPQGAHSAQWASRWSENVTLEAAARLEHLLEEPMQRMGYTSYVDAGLHPHRRAYH